MPYCKGQVTRVRQCSGCAEVTVEGESPGSFPIDNCCLAGILDVEGTHWIGREIEYEDGHLQLVDECEEDSPDDNARPIIPFPYPARSQSHI